ncbi:MAG: LysR family transcriptional regulator [Lautropia sp.]
MRHPATPDVDLSTVRPTSQPRGRSLPGRRALTRLTLRQLEYCLAAAEFGSIALAAESIHVSPSAISSAITRLEAELGVALFVRHHAQGMAITPAGEQVLEQIRGVLDRITDLHEVAAGTRDTVRGSLRVGCFATLAPMVAPELCQGFAQAHPGVQVSQVEDHHEGLLERLRAARIDVAITYDLDTAEPDIAFEPLASLPPHAIVGEHDELARRPSVTIDELAVRPMVLLDLPLSRDYFLALFRQAGLTPLIGARSSSPDVLRSLVANGVGYSLANVRPRTPLSLDGRRVVRVPLSGEHRPMQLGLAWARNREPRRIVEAFMQRCRGIVTAENIPGMDPHERAGE